MPGAFNELFRIEVRHGYFAGGLCPIIEIGPTGRCARMLDRYGCLFRGSAGSGSVYYSDAGLLKGFDEASPFGFAVTAAASELVNCTDMTSAPAARPDATLWYFSNLAPQANRLLHPADEPFRNASLHVVSQPPALPLIDMLGNQIPNPEKEGRYRAQAPAGKPYDFYLSDVAPARRWGIVEIFPQSNRVWDADGRVSGIAVFSLSLAARSSIWRYYVVTQSPADRAYDAYRIEVVPPRGAKGNGGDPSISFRQPESCDLNGKKAWMFESENALPLSEYPADWGRVLLKGGAPASAIALPYAHPATTRLGRNPRTGEVETCSEIFVYL
jgi:hypothetical protein